MSQSFPKPTSVELGAGIKTSIHRLGDPAGTEILLSVMEPGAAIEPHQHEAAQFGLPLAGELELEIARERKLLRALADGYYVAPGVVHAARNASSAPAWTLDFKRTQVPQENFTDFREGQRFMRLTQEKVIKTGLSMRFFVGPWFEVMVSHLPKGATMPVHAHPHEQIGVGIEGSYWIEVGGERRLFRAGEVYHAEGGVLHGGWNPNEEDALSLNIFVPPRYNRARGAPRWPFESTRPERRSAP